MKSIVSIIFLFISVLSYGQLKRVDLDSIDALYRLVVTDMDDKGLHSSSFKDSLQQLSRVRCAELYEESQQLYFSGRLRQVPELLDGCILVHQVVNRSTMSKSQYVEANRISAISNLYLRNTSGAEENISRLLKAQPNYETLATDPPSLTRLIDTYDRDPFFSYEVRLGTGKTFYDIIELYSVSANAETLSPPRYSGNLGIEAGMLVQFKVMPSVFLNGGVQFNAYALLREEPATETVDIRIDEKFRAIELPIGIRYYLLDRDFYIYPEIGASFTKVLKSEAFLLRQEFGAETQLVNFEYDMRPHRNTSFLSGYIGAGAIIPYDDNQVGISVRYSKRFNSFSKEGSSDYILTKVYNSLENRVNTERVSVTLSYFINSYLPRKKKLK